MALNKYVSNYRIYLEVIWLVPKCLDKKPNFMKFHESDAGDRREGTSEACSDVNSGVVTALRRGCSRGVEVESEAGG